MAARIKYSGVVQVHVVMQMFLPLLQPKRATLRRHEGKSRSRFDSLRSLSFFPSDIYLVKSFHFICDC